MQVAEAVIECLVKEGVKHIFLGSGGGMMFLSDAVAKEPRITPVFMHHEQSLAMGAVAYAKHTNSLAVVIVTTGCGGTNAMTGVLEAWNDSVPVLFIAGQDNVSRTISNSNLPLRQFGIQEADLLSIVRPITKATYPIKECALAENTIKNAIQSCLSGRRGPVWVEIPLDIQCKNI